MLGRVFSGKFKKNWVIEPFVWLAVLLLLTLSNISVDVLLAFEISSALTFGMFLLTWVNRGLLLPRFLLNRKLAWYMLLSLLLIAGAIMLFSELETYLVDSYMVGHAEPEAWSPLDCTLPSAESKPFLTKHRSPQWREPSN